MPKKKYLLLDFDGVIVDSLDLAFSISKQNKNNPRTLNEYLKLFRGNIYAHFKNQFKTKSAPVPDFFVQYEPGMLKLVCVPGMPKFIKKMAEKFILIIISSTTQTIIEKFLKKQGLLDNFTAILGPEIERNKTKKITTVFDAYKTNAHDCLFVTDTLGDIGETNKAGVKCVAVTWGYHKKATLAEGRPYAFADSPAGLGEVVSAWEKSIK